MNLLTAADIIAGVACGMIREASIGPSFCGVSKSCIDILMNFLYHLFHSALSRELYTGTLSLLPSWIQSNLPLLEYFRKDGFENKVCLFSSTVREIIKVKIAL